MSIEKIVLIAIMALMLIGVAFLAWKFVSAIRAKRAYETEELPDINEEYDEDEILPDVEESGFARIEVTDDDEGEYASEMYRDIYVDEEPRRSRRH